MSSYLIPDSMVEIDEHGFSWYIPSARVRDMVLDFCNMLRCGLYRRRKGSFLYVGADKEKCYCPMGLAYHRDMMLHPGDGSLQWEPCIHNERVYTVNEEVNCGLFGAIVGSMAFLRNKWQYSIVHANDIWQLSFVQLAELIEESLYENRLFPMERVNARDLHGRDERNETACGSWVMSTCNRNDRSMYGEF